MNSQPTTATGPAPQDSLSPAEFDLANPWEPTSPWTDLSPAYGAAAAVLNDGGWHKWDELHDHMAAACPGQTETALRGFVYKIARQGWIAQGNYPGVVKFRVTKCGLICRPELRGREGQFSTPRLWLEIAAQVDWLSDPRLPRPAPVPEQPRSEPKGQSKKAAAEVVPAPPAPPKVARIVAEEGDLHPTTNCRCGRSLIFRHGKKPPVGDRWQCPDYRGRPDWQDPSHDMTWAS